MAGGGLRHVKFGDGLTVTDEGDGAIRIDGGGGGGSLMWKDVGTGAGAGGGVDEVGIQFDTYPQSGNWLYVATTDDSAAGASPNGLGVEFRSANEIRLRSTASTAAVIGSFGTPAIDLVATAGGIRLLSELVTSYADAAIMLKSIGGMIRMEADVGFYLQKVGASGGHLTMSGTDADLSAGNLYLGGNTQVSISGAKLGFYGVTTVVQPAHPTTLADVITALTSLGLTA